MTAPTNMTTTAGGNLLERFGVSKKLILMLFLPLIGLIVFASLQINAKMQIVSSMVHIEALTRTAVAAGNAVQQLQRERGMTAAVLAGDNAARGELERQQAKTDEAIGEFRRSSRALNFADYDGQVQREVESGLSRVDQLPAHRARVLSGGLSVADGVQFYSVTNGMLAALIGTTARAGEETSVVRGLMSLEALGREKESAGMERALANAALVAGSIDNTTLLTIMDHVGRQGAYETLFLSSVSPEMGHLYREKGVGPFTDELARFRVALSAMAGGQKASVSQHDFWRAATSRIDALHSIEQSLESEILARVGSLRSSAARELTLFAAFAFSVVAIAVAMSVVLGRAMVSELVAANSMLQGSLVQIAAFIQQHSSSSAETAAAVSQTVTTTEELRRTAESAAARASEMSRSGELNRSSSGAAVAAASRGVEAMRKIRGEVEAIAHTILELSEKNIQVGEILQSVNAIAGQSNLLAVNASIEAAKAGDFGKGFAVVAGEVKALAQQSREATGQIRSILAEIQKFSNGAVMTAEQGVKRVEEGASLIEELGKTIETLGGVVEGAADGSAQISLTSTQQLAGIEQITTAMRNVGQATREASDKAHELETAAGSLKAAGHRISKLVEGAQASG